MASRRDFIQYSLALSAASSPLVTAWAAAAEPSAAYRFARFVFDGRFPAAREAAQHAAPAAAAAVRVEGDLTALWYEDLDLEWKRAPMTLAGVTTMHGLFVLETLAADRGMRVVFRGRHTPAGGRIVHTLTGPKAMLADVAWRSEPFWPALGAALTRYAASRETATVERIGSHERASGPAEEALCSWIIAPRSPAARAV